MFCKPAKWMSYWTSAVISPKCNQKRVPGYMSKKYMRFLNNCCIQTLLVAETETFLPKHFCYPTVVACEKVNYDFCQPGANPVLRWPFMPHSLCQGCTTAFKCYHLSASKETCSDVIMYMYSLLIT